jgi:hypothetical protein
MRLSEENIRVTLQDIGMGKKKLDMTLKAQAT